MMLYKSVKLVFLKDLRELLRDKKILLMILLMPVIFLVFAIVGFFVAQSKEKKGPQNSIHIIGDQQLAATLKDKGWNINESKNWQDDLRNNRIDIVLEIPNNFHQHIQDLKHPNINIYYNNLTNDNYLPKAVKKLNSQLAEINSNYRVQISQKLKIPHQTTEAIKTPFKYKEVHAFTLLEIFAYLFSFIATIIYLLTAQTGLISVILDIGTGEKERGTFETLLIAPITPLALTVAKTLVGIVFAFSSVILASCILIIIKLYADKMTFDTWRIFISAFTTLPYLMALTPMFLIVSLVAKTYKEAQSYLGVLMFSALVPVVFLLDQTNKSSNFYWTPFINIGFYIKDILQNTHTIEQFIAFLSTSLMTSFGLIFICSKVVKNNILR